MNLVFKEQANSLVKIKAYYQVALIFLLTLLMLTTRSTCLAYSTSSPPLSDITISDIDGEGCCFQLNYNYDGALGNIDGLETRILTPNVLFSSVQFPLASGWSYNELLTQRRFHWSHNSGSIPQGQQVLADFCFSGWDTAEPVELLIIWRDGNSVRQRDTIQIACSKCWLAENPIVNCEPDSSYTYTFDYVNLSEFTVDYLQIRERNDQNIVIEQNIPLATSLSPGASVAGLQLHFRSAAVQFEEICFEITPRHIINDSIAIRCCTAEYCVPIPICDRCCTAYDVFVTDVERGFTISTNCEEMTVSLQAIGLNECDRVEFDLGLGAGIVRGNEAVIFGNLDEDQFYEVTMTVIRQSMDGEDCYEEASLSIFDNFTFDCDECCTAYDVFVNDVEQGFIILDNCEDMTVTLQALGLNECDRVEFDIGSDSDVVSGNEIVSFSNLTEDQFYEVSMTVIRQSIDGEDCYEEASLTIFDDFVFDCVPCINEENVDYGIICEPVVTDFVCGCDGMTYLNVCAAWNWGGVTSWDRDSICSAALIDSIVVCMTQSGPSSFLLEWTVQSTANLRYILVQGRTIDPVGPWLNLAELPPNATNFTDNSPLDPLGRYRVLGITENGKIIFSVDNPNPICIPNGISEIRLLEGGNLFPNPANQQLNIELPLQDQHLFEIWNSTGQRLYQSQTDYLGKTQVSTAQWPSGYYYITAYINHHTLWRKPFIIDH